MPLAPQKDATSGTYGSFGFGCVLNWCATNRAKIQMLIDFRGASALFLQMDTDIAHQANPNCIQQDRSARDCCQEKLNQQLSTQQEPDRCHYILPTQNTETWLLACQDFSVLDASITAISDYERITDTEQLLATFDAFPSKKSGGGRRRLNKNPAKKYIVHGQKLTANLTIARTRCAELNRLCSIL